MLRCNSGAVLSRPVKPTFVEAKLACCTFQVLRTVLIIRMNSDLCRQGSLHLHPADSSLAWSAVESPAKCLNFRKPCRLPLLKKLFPCAAQPCMRPRLSLPGVASLFGLNNVLCCSSRICRQECLQQRRPRGTPSSLQLDRLTTLPQELQLQVFLQLTLRHQIILAQVCRTLAATAAPIIQRNICCRGCSTVLFHPRQGRST